MSAPDTRPIAMTAAAKKRRGDVPRSLGGLGMGLGVLGPDHHADRARCRRVILDMLLAITSRSRHCSCSVTMNARGASELSTFPTIRLVHDRCSDWASTSPARALILTEGSAGHIIKAFGDYVGGEHLAGRARRLPDPDHHPVHRHHEGLGPHQRSGCALRARRDARQADGDRRRPSTRV